MKKGSNAGSKENLVQGIDHFMEGTSSKIDSLVDLSKVSDAEHLRDENIKLKQIIL